MGITFVRIRHIDTDREKRETDREKERERERQRREGKRERKREREREREQMRNHFIVLLNVRLPLTVMLHLGAG